MPICGLARIDPDFAPHPEGSIAGVAHRTRVAPCKLMTTTAGSSFCIRCHGKSIADDLCSKLLSFTSREMQDLRSSTQALSSRSHMGRILRVHSIRRMIYPSCKGMGPSIFRRASVLPCRLGVSSERKRITF